MRLATTRTASGAPALASASMLTPALALILTITLMLAAACSSLPAAAGPQAASKDFVYVYAVAPASFNYLAQGGQSSLRHTANFIDGLLEHDAYGALSPSLAEEWTHNDDYTVWTFTIRKGAQWVTANIVPWAEIKAADWLTGLQYILQTKSPLCELVCGLVKNAAAWSKGEIVDFDAVGVKALSEYTLQYTLEKPAPWFDSLVASSNAYWPVNEAFLRYRGEAFGALDKDSILYNGAYVLSSYAPRSSIEYSANSAYWDRGRVYIPRVKLFYFDAKDPDALFVNFDAGLYSHAPVYMDNSPLFTRISVQYTNSIFRTPQDASSFVCAFNMNRLVVDVGAKNAAAVQKIDEARAALRNRNFRKALFFGIDRPAMLSRRNGDVNKLAALRNTITASALCADTAGVDYTVYVESALRVRSAVDFPDSFKLSDAQDPYYNPARAKDYMTRAKSELTEAGLVFPLQLDMLVDASYPYGLQMGQALQSGLERLFGADTLKIQIVSLDAGKSADALAQGDYDIAIPAGWSPDFADPYTFLRAFAPLVDAAFFDHSFDHSLEAANAEYASIEARFVRLAALEAELLDDALLLPLMSRGGAFAISRIVPYSGMQTSFGADAEKFKRMIVSAAAQSNADREKARLLWESQRSWPIKKQHQ